MSPLSVATNILRHPKLSIGTPNKAAPTVQVSFSNANAQRGLEALAESVSRSCIPFPSQPIHCTRISPSHAEQSFDASWLTVGTPCSIPAANSANLSGTDDDYFPAFVHRSTHIYSQADPFCMDLEASGHEAWPHPSAPAAPRKRKMAVKRVKASTCPTKAKKRTKRDRTSKKYVADLLFTATLHRSILAHLRTLSAESERALEWQNDVIYNSGASLLHVQDRILVERLWKSLVDQGISPVPFSSPIGDAEQFTLRPERVNHVFQTQPIALGIFDERGMNIDCATIDIPKPPATAPPVSPQSSTANPEILALPQLVASLILRHRDRSSTRHRSQGSCRDRERPGKSPLSKSVKVPALRGRR